MQSDTNLGTPSSAILHHFSHRIETHFYLIFINAILYTCVKKLQ